MNNYQQHHDRVRLDAQDIVERRQLAINQSRWPALTKVIVQLVGFLSVIAAAWIASFAMGYYLFIKTDSVTKLAVFVFSGFHTKNIAPVDVMFSAGNILICLYLAFYFICLADDASQYISDRFILRIKRRRCAA
ncbi:hypothetical protein [Xanthomonas axonopodis]|uniref:hypothetical protein n=1 Tax=Xanthomonas axonopodis TaxID=53413 RepID=UPI0035590E78